MKQSAEGSNNANIQERQQTTVAGKLAKNATANEVLVKKEFPDEIWVSSDNLTFKYVTIPKNATEILVAKSRLPINKQEELDFLKEIKSAIILSNLGACVTLIPRIKNPNGRGFIPGPDAIVNGLLFEFKEVTGSINKVGDRFMDSRRQGNNVYIRVANTNLTKRHVMSYFTKFINDKNYEGNLSPVLVAEYTAKLPDKKLLQNKLRELNGLADSIE